MSMKKRHYTLAGLTLAALVFAVIVVAGLLGEETTPASEAAGANGGSTALPSGHPSVATGTGESAGMGTTGADSDLAAMIASLEKKYETGPRRRQDGRRARRRLPHERAGRQGDQALRRPAR